jgi:hypothetical protein
MLSSLQSPMKRSRIRISKGMAVSLTLSFAFAVFMGLPASDLLKLKQQVHKPPLDRPATAAQPQPQAATRDGWELPSADNFQEMLQMDAQEWETQARQRMEQIVSRLDDSFYREPGRVTEVKAAMGEDLEGDESNGNALGDVR